MTIYHPVIAHHSVARGRPLPQVTMGQFDELLALSRAFVRQDVGACDAKLVQAWKQVMQRDVIVPYVDKLKALPDTWEFVAASSLQAETLT